MSRLAPSSGPLYLGVNDARPAGNGGHFVVTIELDRPLQPVCLVQRVPPGGPQGRPCPNAQVVIFYVDGLRPDVVREMSAMGHLPHITQTFLEGGTQVAHSLTVFPSDTVTANASLWTGCFSDRHGLKAQVGFDRKTGRTENYLESFGPVLSGLVLHREGADRWLLATGEAATRAVRGAEGAQRFRAVRTSDTPPLAALLAQQGKTYGAGILPIMGDLSPRLWTRYLTDEAPYLGTQHADRYVDEANTAYAIEHLLQQRDDVMIVWLPETDTVSHHEFRGQFGMARRTIAEADQMIGEVVGHLRRQGRLDKTYLILVSDHGHHGGEREHLDRFDLANEFFHRPREVTADGRWVGGGLGMTVRQHRWVNQTQGDGPEQFAFVEAVGDGVGRVFLPRGAYWSGNWSGPNHVADLLRYPVAPHLPPANLFQMLASLEAHDVCPEKRFPIDLVLAQLDEMSILIHHRQRGWAVIDRACDAAGRWLYRYRVATDVQVVDDAGHPPRRRVAFRLVPFPAEDPLGLANVVPRDAWGGYFDERTWLHWTLATPYPDSVVTMTRHLLWDAKLKGREQRLAPDLVVCAAPGWQFNTFNEPGTAHGHPLHATMRNALFVSGPGVRRGAVLSEPARAVDLAPTVLAMVGAKYDPRQFDGQPLWSLFEGWHEGERPIADGGWRPGESDLPRSEGFPADPTGAIADGAAPWASPSRSGAGWPPCAAFLDPVFWHEVDLGAWAALPYHPRGEYPHQPRSANQPQSFWDLSNVVHNALSLAELSVNRLIDDGALLLGSPQPPARTFYRHVQASLEAPPVPPAPREGEAHWLAQGTQSLYWNKIALSDYNLYSTANLARVDAALDWGQGRWDRLDEWVADQFGAPARAAPLANAAIDALQYVVWETRRVGVRVAARILEEGALQGIEDGATWALNLGRDEPAQVLVTAPPQRLPSAVERLPPLDAISR